jgi:transcriptional regulator with XRE-family HTH domain
VLLRQEIGRRLRAAREAAGLALETAAPLLETSTSTLSRIEKGATAVTVHLVRSMSDLYDQRLDELVGLVRDARRPGWWKAYGISDTDFVALETGASLMSNYELVYIPGLLQTAGYTRALFQAVRRARDEEWITNRLAVRSIRQERLVDCERPLELDVVIHEFALRCPVGGLAVMRAQLRHLVLATDLPTVTLRVLPASPVVAEALESGFTLLDFPWQSQPSIVHVMHALGVERKEKIDQVRGARLRFEHLRSLALEPEDSVALIERVADDLG